MSGLWSTVAGIGGIPRYAAFSFSINNEAFVGTGSFYGVTNPIRTSDFWRFSVCSDSLSSGIEQISAATSIYHSVSTQQSSLILRYDLKGQREVQFNLYDVLGREMISTQLNTGSNYRVLPVAFSKWVYLYSAKNNQQVLGSSMVEID